MNVQEAEIVILAEAAGGVMRHIIDLYKGLRAKGWNTQLILSPLRLEPRYRSELDTISDSRITYLPIRRSPHISDWTAYKSIKRKLKATNSRIILHSHSTKAGMLGSLLTEYVSKSIFTPHAYRGMDPTLSPVTKTVLQQIERNYSQAYNRVIAVAPVELEYAKSLGLDPDTLGCIPNGIDVSNNRFSVMFAKRQTLSPTPCLGFVGRLVYQKNPLLFVEVLAEVVRRGCDARAIIIGDGDLRGDMMSAIAKYGLKHRVEWRGEISAICSLEEMDFMVHTSRYEALPYSLIEACGALLPIVAAANQGSTTIMAERLSENLSYTADAQELASIVISLTHDNPRRVNQLAELEATAYEFSVERMVASLEAEYRALLQ